MARKKKEVTKAEEVVEVKKEVVAEEVKETPKDTIVEEVVPKEETKESEDKPAEGAPVESVEKETTLEDTETLPEEENVSEELVETSAPYVEPTLYDAWDRPIPTVTLCLEDVDFNRLVNRVVQAGNYGAELNPTKEVKVHGVPYQIHLIMSQEEFDKYSLEEKHASYDESVEYGKVTVQAQDRQLFFKNLLAISKLGAVVEPATGIYKTPTYRASVLTRAPVEASANVIVGPVKVKYSQGELESFDIKQLSIIGSWYNISLKAKKAYVKAILEKQG